MWVGITGPMGSGKSTVAHLLRQMGLAVLDADQVATKVLSPGSPGEAEVLKTFGQQLKDRQGHLNRRALGRLVFADPKKLETLEKIIHPRVRDEITEQREALAKLGRVAAFYDVPLLFEKKMRDQFDHVLVVSTDEALRNARVKTRSQLTDQEIEERTKFHIPSAIKEASASFVIKNSGDLEGLRGEILRALAHLKIPLPAST